MLKNSVNKVAPNAQNGGPRVPKVAKRCPKGSQKWSKNDQKSILGTLSSICYLLYELHIGRSWGGSQRDKNTVAFSEPSQEGSRGAPMAQRWSKGSKMGAQRVSKMEQKASKRGPKNTSSFLLHPLAPMGGPGALLKKAPAQVTHKNRGNRRARSKNIVFY